MLSSDKKWAAHFGLSQCLKWHKKQCHHCSDLQDCNNCSILLLKGTYKQVMIMSWMPFQVRISCHRKVLTWSFSPLYFTCESVWMRCGPTPHIWRQYTALPVMQRSSIGTSTWYSRTLLGRGRDMAISPTVVSLGSHWINRENINVHYLFRQCMHPSQLTHFSQSTMLINVFICFLHWTSKQVVPNNWFTHDLEKPLTNKQVPNAVQSTGSHTKCKCCTPQPLIY